MLPDTNWFIVSIVLLAGTPVAVCGWWLVASHQREQRKARVAERMAQTYPARRSAPDEPWRIGRHLRLGGPARGEPLRWAEPAACAAWAGYAAPRGHAGTAYVEPEYAELDGYAALDHQAGDIGGRHRLVDDDW